MRDETTLMRIASYFGLREKTLTMDMRCLEARRMRMITRIVKLRSELGQGITSTEDAIPSSLVLSSAVTAAHISRELRIVTVELLELQQQLTAIKAEASRRGGCKKTLLHLAQGAHDERVRAERLREQVELDGLAHVRSERLRREENGY